MPASLFDIDKKSIEMKNRAAGRNSGVQRKEPLLFRRGRAILYFINNGMG
jgi:hypothetical protein